MPAPQGGTAPPVPANKYALPRQGMRFFPRLEDESRHPTRWEFPECLDGSVPWVAELKALYGMGVSFPASISPQAGLLLHALVRNIGPRRVVEVGTFLGASTVWMAAGLGAGAVLHAFDNFEPVDRGPWRGEGTGERGGDRLAEVCQRIARSGLGDRVVLHKGVSWEELETSRGDLKEAGGVDLALLDGDHSPPGVWRDLWALEPVLNTGGYVLLHDTYPEQCGGHLGPREVLDQINERTQGLYEACEVYLAPLNYGLGLVRRIG